ncbi:MAG: hypothetical protein IT538_04105, partial [Variibacter sp.]|nr:hypothetical protein [Variibacter sp.]
MSDPLRAIEQAETSAPAAPWSGWLMLYVRVLAVLALAKGLYHWARVCGIGDGPDSMFENASVA